MFLLISSVLFIFTGTCECGYNQKIVCPYSPDQKHLNRVWCKRDASDHKCCTGFAFSEGISDLDGGSLKVQDDGSSFMVSVNSLSQGDGVYWCGVMNKSNIIIKLAEGPLYTIPPAFVWSILRWILFLLLLLSVISTSIYSKRKSGK